MATKQEIVERQNSLEIAARNHLKEHSAFFQTIDNNRFNRIGFSDRIVAKVTHLVKHFPDLDNVRIAAIVGVGEKFVRGIKGRQYDRPDDEEQNPTFMDETNAELRALHGTGRDGYTDDERAQYEDRFEAGPVLIVSDRAHYKADQSHTAKRPITLPTKPFDIAA
jgi:hypothetical protein